MSSIYGEIKEVCVSTITTTAFLNHGLVILKLAAKLDSAVYSIWIKPPKTVIGTISFPEGLKCQNGELINEKKLLPSVPLKTALLMFHAFLKTSPVPVLLVDFSSQDLGKVLLSLIQTTGLVDLFHGVIFGFTMAYELWKERHINYHGTNHNLALSLLVKYHLKKIYEPHRYETTYRLLAIESLAKKLSSVHELIENSASYEEAFTKAMRNPNTRHIYLGLEPLLSAVPETALKAMATEQLSYATLEKVFQERGSFGLQHFLTDKWNLHPLLSANDYKILRNILQFFQDENSHSSPAEPAPTEPQDVTMDEPSSSWINPSSAFAQQSSSSQEEDIPIVQHQRDQDRLEQLQRDREFVQEWHQIFDPFY